MPRQQRYSFVSLTENFDEAEMRLLQSFGSRFKEFWENFEDLRKSGFSLSNTLQFEYEKVSVNATNLGVSRFRIKGFLVDYRHFHGQKEPSHFHSILNVVKRRCRDIEAAEALEVQRKNWESAGALCGWHNNFVLDDFIDALFKESIFHTIRNGKSARVYLRDVEGKLTPSAVWYEAAYMAYSRLLVIRNVHWMLEPVFSGRSEIRIPCN